MIEIIKQIVQYIAIGSFGILTFISFIQKDWNMTGLNFSLVLLYLFLYVQPISK